MEMKGLVAIVTGASRGIGRAIAKEYARHGAKVVVAARPDTPTGLQDTVFETAKVIQQEGGEALPVACDVADEQQVDDMVRQATEHYGRIDVLVNNAGIFFPLTHCVEIEPDRWDQLMAVNGRGPYLTCRRVLPPNGMRLSDGRHLGTSGWTRWRFVQAPSIWRCRAPTRLQDRSCGGSTSERLGPSPGLLDPIKAMRTLRLTPVHSGSVLFLS